MKKIKLMSTLALLLVFVLPFGGEDPRAGSRSGDFEMSSDVLCGAGGKAQSANFTLSSSAGGQSSPVGQKSSFNFSASVGWLYTADPEFIRGDTNGDGVIELGDVVLILNFLFKSGTAPCPEQSGDVTCDATVDLGDAIFLLNYLYKGGPAPCPGKEEPVVVSRMSKIPADRGHAQLWLSLDYISNGEGASCSAKPSFQAVDQDYRISVMARFDRDLAGVQLEIEFDPAQVIIHDPVPTFLTESFQLFCGTEDNVQKIGMVDLSGQKTLPAGEGPILILPVTASDLSSIKIKKALLFDAEANSLITEAGEELDGELEKSSQSKPEHFSLMQNYPNPFNPTTSIGYALPEDAQVRLTVYNVLGQKVATLIDEQQSAGYKTILWHGTDQNGERVGSGVYFYRLEADEFSEVNKMMLVK